MTLHVIRDLPGGFVSNHVDLSDGRVALKVSSREVEILGESLVKEVIGWAMESKSSPWPEYGNYDADFLAGLTRGQQDVEEGRRGGQVHVQGRPGARPIRRWGCSSGCRACK